MAYMKLKKAMGQAGIEDAKIKKCVTKEDLLQLLKQEIGDGVEGDI